MKKIWFFLGCLIVGDVYADHFDELQSAFELRIKDPHRSSAMIDNMSELTFVGEQREKVKYLRAFHMALHGELEQSLAQMAQIDTDNLKDKELAAAVLTTMLSVNAGVKTWGDSFHTLHKLRLLLETAPELLSSQTRQNMIFSISNFFWEIGEYDEVVSMMSNLMHQRLTSEDKCRVFSLMLSAQVEKADFEKSKETIQRFEDVCSDTKPSISSHLVKVDKLKVLWHDNAERAVIEKAMAFEPEVILFGYTPSTRTLQVFIAQMAYELNDIELALSYVNKVIGDGKEMGYYRPYLEAYQIAANVNTQIKNNQKAVYFLNKYIALNHVTQENSAKLLLAIEKAKFDVQKVEAEMEMLDSENKLLHTKAELSRERMESTLLLLLFVSILVCFLVYWSWRAKKVQKRLKIAAEIDYLTKTYNRSFFTQKALERLDKLRNKRSSTAIILLDLDHFKRINDSYGHQVGDWALKAVARTLNSELDAKWTLARMGGEEFAIFLEGSNAQEAISIAENCRNIIEKIDTKPTKQSFVITASFGVSDTTSVGYNFDNLMSAADLALYQSKSKGRNKVYEYSNNLSFSK
ncbi:GGDEF domain-containing protein [Alteromonas sp. 5E99-2]|uniref:GGDEF domain-containing protein n=1 Tax=Alteromonas sp. 5E99-2 TaxID=2817683 RepID=UPI001A997C52|nr:GGDEF domain-containing protein [Alteromonas sp. 5E99-2]MBO1255398.1 GGDEF domain-containing protein [Alteromonas sp. 5E99-2]